MTPNNSAATHDDVEAVLLHLLAYCRKNNWAGYDPYDALNSRALDILPFLNSWLSRLVLTQALKRSAINMRVVLGVPKKRNAKAIALFLSAFLKLSKTRIPDRQSLIQEMINDLVDLRSPN